MNTCVNIKLSKRFKRIVRARNRECWNNAVAAMGHFPKGTRKLYYVEGYAIPNGGIPLPVLHGWLEYRGEIIETTPTWLEQHQRGGQGNAYFPARKWNRSQLIRRALLPSATLPLTHYEWRDCRFRTASEQAYRHLLGDAAYDKMRQSLSQWQQEVAA